MTSGEQTTAELGDMLRKVLEKLDTVSTEVGNLNSRLNTMEQKVDHLNAIIGVPEKRDLFKEVKAVREEITVLDYYSSRFDKNMIIKGIKDEPKENLDMVVRRLLCDRLDISVERINHMAMYSHRMPRLSADDVTLPIYVKFMVRDDREYVHGKVEKRKKALSEVGISVNMF